MILVFKKKTTTALTVLVCTATAGVHKMKLEKGPGQRASIAVP
jgi:hypothetical protein